MIRNPAPSQMTMSLDFGRAIGALAHTEGSRLSSEALRLLREETGASAVFVLRTAAGKNAEVLLREPSNSNFDHSATVADTQEALARGEMIVRTPAESWGAHTVAILPIASEPGFSAVLVVLWRHEVAFEAELGGFLEIMGIFLRGAVPAGALRAETEGERDRLAAVLDTLPEGVAFFDHRGECGWVNREAARLLEVAPGAVPSGLMASAIGRMHQKAKPSTDQRARSTGARKWTWVLDGPEARVVSITSRLTRLGNVDGRLWSFTDITEQSRAEDAFRASEDRYRDLFENSPMPAWVYDLGTLAIVTVNHAASLLYGYTREEFLTMTLVDLRPAEEVPKLLSSIDRIQKTREKSGPWLHRKKDGGQLVVEINSHEVTFSGRPARFVMVNDITERTVAERQLREQEERWQLALQGTNDGLWDYDITRNAVFYSRRWKEILGYQDHELPNLPEEWERRVHPDDLPGVQTKLQDHLSRKAPFYEAEYRIAGKDGTYRWVLGRGQAVWDENYKPVRMVGSHTDITERKESEERLKREALYDSLTGVLNRRQFLEELDRAVGQAEERNSSLTIAMGDMDGFKAVNDTYGHAAGDEVLAVFGQIVQQQSQKPCDFAGRIGGDEFCVVFPDTSLESAELAVETMRARLAKMAFGVSRGAPFSVSAAFGIAEWQPGVTCRAFLEEADRALYRAKQRRAGPPLKRTS